MPKRKSKGKGHKCIHNLKKIKRRKKFIKFHKKYLVPLILGLLAAKSLLLPIALKTVAFMSAKGLMMSFFSTVLAALLTLKGILDHSYGYQNRNDDKMRVLCFVLLAVVACRAAPGPSDDGRIELFSGVAIEKDASGEEKLNVKFEAGELSDAARTFEEARGKIKKYTPLITGIGLKIIAVVAILFGGLTLLVTKALVVAKLAFMAAAALGLQKLLSGGGLNNISGKIASFQTSPQQWSSPTASGASYPYARSANIAQDANDLAYKAQITS
ncbi:hypothetical protein K1T71_013639 [Dendrolimus kikuchii]|uniref:Uncharacterized protein n=1 Tax=Dendrolimus kikuchii TaxID=765133 RepID=A0ACC1CH28_9NEOP|nr:hypothetical protein K1T71_013639 [Dendrolimus kikuchii]